MRQWIRFVIVDPEYRGKGIAQEMLRLILSHAFNDAKTKRVSLIVFSQNPDAKRCYEKAGFTERKTGNSPDFAYKEEVWNRCCMVMERNHGS